VQKKSVEAPVYLTPVSIISGWSSGRKEKAIRVQLQPRAKDGVILGLQEVVVQALLGFGQTYHAVLW
jgi:hypothetical protein